MSKIFNLSATVAISIFTEVTADSLEEAISIAQDRDIESTEYGNKNQCEYVWVSEEFDGSITDIHES